MIKSNNKISHAPNGRIMLSFTRISDQHSAKKNLLWWVDSCIEFTLIFFTSVRPLFFPSNLSCYLRWSWASFPCFSSGFSLGRLGFRAGYGITTVFDQSLIISWWFWLFFSFSPRNPKRFHDSPIYDVPAQILSKMCWNTTTPSLFTLLLSWGAFSDPIPIEIIPYTWRRTW